jgi:hypothetical protein
LKFFLKKPETGSNRPVLVWFGFLGQNWFKPVWLGFFRFDLIFQVWLGFFSGLAQFFPVRLSFGLVFSIWLDFGSVFFWFRFDSFFSVSGL